MTVTSSIDIRYPDCDPMGVVHHAVYPLWLEIARMDYFAALGWPWERVHPLFIDPAMGEMTVKYRAALRYPGKVTVTTRCVLCEPKKLKLAYECRQGDTLACTAETFHIWVKNAEKSVRLCDELPEMYESILASLEA